MTNSTLSVRPAERRDLEAIMRLKLALQTEEESGQTYITDHEQWLASMFGDQPEFEALVAEQGDAP
jgi:hypothetical protein